MVSLVSVKVLPRDTVNKENEQHPRRYASNASPAILCSYFSRDGHYL